MTDEQKARQKIIADAMATAAKRFCGDEAVALDNIREVRTVANIASENIWNACLAHAEDMHTERVKALVTQLQNCIDAIETLPQDVFGVGGDGETHWYVRDELLARAKEALQGDKK